MQKYAALAWLAMLGACAPATSLTQATPARKLSVWVVPRPRIMTVLPGTYTVVNGATTHASFDDTLRRRYGAESYELRIDAAGVRIRAGGPAGAFYAAQTFAQLTRADGGRRIVPFVRIVDWPAYRWRGIELDVSRHFFDAATVKRVIEIESHYKLNVFHWHLTDDQAWRLPIAAFPRLAASPSYSAQDVRDVIAFARSHHVTVVPEIETAGHHTAASRAYPGLTASAAFWRAVITATAHTFPGAYLHIGGDEVDYTPLMRARVRDIAQSVRAAGKIPVAWDDAQAAALPKPAAYMVWRRYVGLQPALRTGNDVVLAPDGPLYFDAYQGDRAQEPPASPHMSTLEEVYDYNPPAGSRILGIQANVWTEKIRSPGHLWYMLLPRALALAESAWDAPREKNWPDFLRRLPFALDDLDERRITFRVPSVQIEPAGASFFPVRGHATSAIARVNGSRAKVALSVALHNARIVYTTDGSVPARNSRKYAGPFVLRITRSGVVVRAMAFDRTGRSSTVSSCLLVRKDALHAIDGSRAWTSIVSP